MPNYKLYIWIRSDLASMTAGKCAAQVAHAASQAAHILRDNSDYKEWESSARKEMPDGSPNPDHYKHFGTTIVLDGVNDKELEYVYENARKISGAVGMVIDPSYPIKDGLKMHFVNIPTCVWMFASDEIVAFKHLTSRYSLYEGNLQ